MCLLFVFPQKKRPTEPIYAEPSKTPPVQHNPASSSVDDCSSSSSSSGGVGNGSGTPNSNQMRFDEYDGVQLRHSAKSNAVSDSSPKCDSAGASSNKISLKSDKDSSEAMSVGSGATNENSRHSDSKVLMEYSGSNSSYENISNAQRKFHSKSFSLTENCIEGSASKNPFRQNRELWEKRAELQSQQSLTTPRILTRNRIAPDLVMDLPFSSKDGAVHSSRESLDSNEGVGNDSETSSNVADEKDGNEIAGCTSASDSNGKTGEDMTSAERFATQNQCTLRKNERFSGSTNAGGTEGKTVHLDKETTKEKPKAEVKPQENALLKELATAEMERIKSSTNSVNKLHIDECCTSTTSSTDSNVLLATTPTKDSQHKSPIPLRNTQKFVSKFADLHLTGGCLISGGASAAPATIDTSLTSQQSLSSFKPQVKVKPNILRKPLVLPPTTPESLRRHQE